jgi:hypothetical protein
MPLSEGVFRFAPQTKRISSEIKVLSIQTIKINIVSYCNFNKSFVAAAARDPWHGDTHESLIETLGQFPREFHLKSYLPRLEGKESEYKRK